VAQSFNQGSRFKVLDHEDTQSFRSMKARGASRWWQMRELEGKIPSPPFLFFVCVFFCVKRTRVVLFFSSTIPSYRDDDKLSSSSSSSYGLLL
jgi:hypothetical protein